MRTRLSKKPIVLYDGLLGQLYDNDNIGRYVFSVEEKTTSNNGDELVSFTQIHADTTNGSFNLKLPEEPLVGDVVRIIDIKDNFENNNLTIEPNSKLIERQSHNVIFDTSGVIIEFFYSGETDGWLKSIAGADLDLILGYLEFDIDLSQNGSRENYLIFQTSDANKADLTDANDTYKMPALGVVIFDGDTFVRVDAQSGSLIDVKATTATLNDVSPGDDIYVSTQTGKVTSKIEDENPNVVQRVGICNTATSTEPDCIRVNFWPNPETYK